MEWFNRKTAIAGIQIPNWGIVLAIVCRSSRSQRGQRQYNRQLSGWFGSWAKFFALRQLAVAK
jgi:hypothetical protein